MHGFPNGNKNPELTNATTSSYSSIFVSIALFASKYIEKPKVQMRALEGTTLTLNPDCISWSLEHSDKFSVRSLYRKLCQGTEMKHYIEPWKISIPLKVRVFL
jgi:hypothetical protein